jgi:hypothetical protein
MQQSSPSSNQPTDKNEKSDGTRVQIDPEEFRLSLLQPCFGPINAGRNSRYTAGMVRLEYFLRLFMAEEPRVQPE